MSEFRLGAARAVVLGVAVSMACGEVRAQSGSGGFFSMGAPPVSAVAPVSGAQAAPGQFPIISPLQVIGANSSGFGGTSGQSNMFNNPWAAPMLYGSMFGMGANPTSSSSSQTSQTSQTATSMNPMGLSSSQMGIMMLASMPGMTGIGSGQLSGVRPGASSAQSRGSQRTSNKVLGTSSDAGGLAARYFNRTFKISRYPQSYFNRQTQYFPVSGR
jgi:hypothetical protein